MVKKLLKPLCVCILLNSFYLNSLLAQDSTTVSVKPYGFIRNYLTFDSRKTYTVIGGEYNMIPYDEKWNADHSEDLNAVPSMQLQALTSRFGFDIRGPQWRGMHLNGKLEGDFGGFGTTNSVLRLRLAYVKLETQGSKLKNQNSLLLGQDWHPLSGDIMPEVLGMAAGAPFRPHSRTPQIRATQEFKIHDSEFIIGYSAALLWQLQYMNNGPASATDPASAAGISYANNALWPEAYIGLIIQNPFLKFVLGVDSQLLRPRTHAAGSDGVVRKVDETVESITPTLYFRILNPKFDIQFRTLLAQNTSHLNQLCGYAVTGLHDDGSWNYQPLRNSISYLNIAYGRKYRANLFVGYIKNLGAPSDLHDFGTAGVPSYLIYMKGGTDFTGLNSIYRIAPSVSYNVKAFNFGLEYEWTACTYGDISADGSISNNDNLHQVSNHRICALVKYNF